MLTQGKRDLGFSIEGEAFNSRGLFNESEIADLETKIPTRPVKA
jgi:hypothetical protein